MEHSELEQLIDTGEFSSLDDEDLLYAFKYCPEWEDSIQREMMLRIFESYIEDRKQ